MAKAVTSLSSAARLKPCPSTDSVQTQLATGEVVLLPNWLSALNAELIACTRCPRLVEYRQRIAREKRRAYLDCEYWGKPVSGFGDPNARVLILGLAPAAFTDSH